MRSDILVRSFLIVGWAVVALIAQITLQHAANVTRDLIFSQNIPRYLIHFIQIGVASLASLLMTFLCFRNMTFSQFLFSQGFFYILAFVYSFIALNEPFSYLKLLAILCFLPGLLLALGTK